MRNKKLYAMAFGAVMIFVVVLAVILYGWFRMLRETNIDDEKKSQTEVVTNFGTENLFEDYENNVTNFGTLLDVVNLDEMAAPLLEADTEALEKELYEYLLRNEMQETECSIIHVMVPEQNENQLFFFCQFSTSEDIVQVVFDREKDVFVTIKSYYSREDILNEIWNGACPPDRDIQE